MSTALSSTTTADNGGQPTLTLRPLTYKPLHDTFVAEVEGADLANPTPDLVDEIKRGLAKYGVLVFRKTNLDDHTHVALSKMFGELDDVTPYNKLGRINRLQYDELFDVSNIQGDGTLIQPGSQRDILGKGNQLFHVDSAFNPRRAGYSMLLAHELPPKGTGGNTEFVDSRTAYDELPEDTKERVKNYALAHSQLQSRQKANPGHPLMKEPQFNPENDRQGIHKLVQIHEPSGRKNMYIANHAYRVVDKELKEGQAEIQELLDHATQPKYVCAVEWNQPGDLVMWDNTCVLHRACPGSFEGKYKRDMRRTTVHDQSTQAWGLNEVGATWRSGLP